MDLRAVISIGLLISMQFLYLSAQAESGGSVVFFDTPSQRYIRNRAAGESKSLSVEEVVAAVSVLLGLAPPSSLSPESSSKLNEVLLSNPFNRPRAVFVLEVQGMGGPLLPTDQPISHVGSSYGSSLLGLNKAKIQLPGEDEISIVALDEPLDVDCDATCVQKELHNLAHLLGGSYASTVGSLDGELNVPLSSGTSIKLHFAKSVDREFALSLVTLARKIKKAMDIHEDFARSGANPAELMIGRFKGIEIFKEEYGLGDSVYKGIELFRTAVGKLFDSLQMCYGGKIVGVVLSSEKTPLDSEAILDATLSAQASRWLEEASPDDVAIAEVLLVRRSLAWITGVILLVSTLTGIYYLLNMPLTRDTLLYSNVKID